MFTALITPPPAAQADDRQRFMRLLQTALAEGSFAKLLLSKYSGAEAGLERLTVRTVQLRGERCLSFLWRYQTRDITKNHALEAGLAEIEALLGRDFQNAHLQTAEQELQLAFSRKGRPSLRVSRRADAAPAAAAADAGHDKEKLRYLELAKPFWADLGLTHEAKGGERQLVPAMSRKWKQINKFIEVMSAALKSSPLAASSEVHVSDFGSGKGYLTFAMYDWLTSVLGRKAEVSGIELREDMVSLCNGAAQRHGLTGLRFVQSDVRHYQPARLDVMIALHACDIATDYAIHLGLRAGAGIIMCSPCCHKQLRPQMQLPAALKPMLQHGIHLGQEAEMVTDSLRALLLEAEGYETQVFEFIALEHTSKNKMILAVKKSGAALAAAQKKRPEILAQIAEIKRFYGLREQALESLLLDQPAAGVACPA
ncbi:SAM-dependent methyltransferase [Kinneretia asaccharophila]|uniref:Methyltransferase family protein n=1 Tax=Roseateles asaccharophilus TaxID=582607 RepID=A0A4R6N9S2_9BURK|nr:SAM-dependent methyltransferase [Roseateles asaccharophilus]MDN3546030.1 SAM-dependent methyltransferase [Roseateles asaccharophilus]TDP11241.1 methyltransferase family protein [Roseateles asaccharophilus]